MPGSASAKSQCLGVFDSYTHSGDAPAIIFDTMAIERLSVTMVTDWVPAHSLYFNQITIREEANNAIR